MNECKKHTLKQHKMMEEAKASSELEGAKTSKTVCQLIESMGEYSGSPKEPKCKYCYDKGYFTIANGGQVMLGDFIGDASFYVPLTIEKHPCSRCQKKPEIDEYSGTPKEPKSLCCNEYIIEEAAGDNIGKQACGKCFKYLDEHAETVKFGMANQYWRCPHGVVGTEGANCPKCEEEKKPNWCPVHKWEEVVCDCKDQPIESKVECGCSQPPSQECKCCAHFTDPQCKQPSVNSREVEKCAESPLDCLRVSWHV